MLWIRSNTLRLKVKRREKCIFASYKRDLFNFLAEADADASAAAAAAAGAGAGAGAGGGADAKPTKNPIEAAEKAAGAAGL